jgi:hypothetical protein
MTARKKEGLDAAIEMIKITFLWRHTILPGKLQNITPNNILLGTRDTNLAKNPVKQYIPQALHGEDKEGLPLLWERSGEIVINYAEIKTVLSVEDLLVEHIRFSNIIYYAFFF